MNIGASLYHLSTNARAFSPKDSARVNQGSGDQFINALLSKTSAGRDTFIQSGQDRNYFMHDTKIRNALFQTKGQPHAVEIQDVETERYSITARRRGELCIHDKMRDENFVWDLSNNNVQVDAKTGSKFLIDNLGSGFFIMAAVDSELENGLKQALGVDALEEKDLIGFTVHQDRKTGIRYITANGYESQGGLIIMDDNAHKQLFHGMKLNVHRVVPDHLTRESTSHKLHHMEYGVYQLSEPENKYCSLCGSRIRADGSCPICIIPTFISGNKQSYNQNVSQVNSNKLTMLPRSSKAGRKA